ncbi:hypothetical protein RHMOL_Rhmol05G0148100 [Rhododendron molle]|uniref:Uncharacterized protein n=1 Tax=Rhododendron molle TaxID=49168 RepID=A0ACC0NQM4_RHOML|nr:hypothetical protein RHMOL_Rhmol05G0148100 [Rhododendron molle]
MARLTMTSWTRMMKKTSTAAAFVVAPPPPLFPMPTITPSLNLKPLHFHSLNLEREKHHYPDLLRLSNILNSLENPVELLFLQIYGDASTAFPDHEQNISTASSFHLNEDLHRVPTRQTHLRIRGQEKAMDKHRVHRLHLAVVEQIVSRDWGFVAVSYTREGEIFVFVVVVKFFIRRR